MKLADSLTLSGLNHISIGDKYLIFMRPYIFVFYFLRWRAQLVLFQQLMSFVQTLINRIVIINECKMFSYSFFELIRKSGVVFHSVNYIFISRINPLIGVLFVSCK